MQAKRWTDRVVRSPDIRDFIGALQIKRATKGVYITTSAFSHDAEEAAERAHGGIVLVNGKRLCEL